MRLSLTVEAKNPGETTRRRISAPGISNQSAKSHARQKASLEFTHVHGKMQYPGHLSSYTDKFTFRQLAADIIFSVHRQEHRIVP